MTTNRMTKLGVLAGMASGVLISTFALGQQDTAPREVRGELHRPLRANGEQPAAAAPAHSSMMMSRNDNGDEVTVRIENGETTATRNGKAVPADKIRRSDNKIEILGDDGEVVSTFNVAVTSGFPAQIARGWKPAKDGVVVEGRPLNLAKTSRPKVMIGVNMSAAKGKLAEHLGLKEGGVVLDSVIEGLPAAKAGLKSNDVIIEMEGKKTADENDIRDMLKNKNPGDTIKVKFIRQGAASQEATITLEGFDAAKLGADSTWVTPGFEIEGGNPFVGGFGPEDGSSWVFRMNGQGNVEIDHEKIREALSNAMKEMEDKHKQMDEVRVEVRKHLAEAMKELERSHKEFEKHSKELGKQLRIDSLPRLSNLFGGKDSVLVAPVAPAAPMTNENESQKNDKFDRILESLDRLNKRLDDLEKRVETKK